MEPRVTIGIDLARRAHHQAVVVMRDGSRRPRAYKVDTTAEALDALLDAVGGPQGCRVVLEPCGLIWLPLAAYLLHRGCEVVTVDTRAASQFRRFINRTVKSDRVDAEAIARMPSANPKCSRPVHIPSAQHFAVQRLATSRAQLVKDRSREILRLLASLEAYVPGLPAVVGRGQTITAVKAFLLRHFLHPKAVLDAGVEGMRQALAEAKIAVADDTSLLRRWYNAAQRAWSIWGPLEQAGRCPVDFAVAQIEIDLHLDRIDELSRHIARLERCIAKAYRSLDPQRVVKTLPGIGATIAAALRAFISDIRRFPNAKAFVGYLGLAPRKNQSGNTNRTGQRMSKAGNRLLRHYFFLAADVARRVDLELAAYYERKRAAGVHYTKVIIAIANKLARRLYAVLKREANGDTAGYRFYDQDEEIDAKESSRRTRARHSPPSASQKQDGQDPKTNDERQSSNSPKPDTGHPATAEYSPSAPRAKAASTGTAVSVGDDLNHVLGGSGAAQQRG